MKVNYEMVDLGLPSGLKWAKCNLGAEKETDYGLYFQWGSTKGYTLEEIEEDEMKCSRNGVPYYDRSANTYSKYNSWFDKKEILDKYDDAVSKIMGLNYRMPTKEDFNELLGYTTNEWVEVNGVNGRKFTSKINGNSIFIPTSGYAWRESVNNQGYNGYVWCSSLDTNFPNGAYNLNFNSYYCSMDYRSRDNGFSVRAVSN